MGGPVAAVGCRLGCSVVPGAGGRRQLQGCGGVLPSAVFTEMVQGVVVPWWVAWLEL